MKQEVFFFFLIRFYFKEPDLHFLVGGGGGKRRQILSVIRIPYFSVLVHYPSSGREEFNSPLCESFLRNSLCRTGELRNPAL